MITRLLLLVVILFLPLHASAGTFSIVLMSDTQNIVVGSQGFQNMIDWIIDNEDAYNIIFVAHVGDVVSHGIDDDGVGGRWEHVSGLVEQLEDAGILVGIVSGNHDTIQADNDIAGPNASNMLGWFPISRYQQRPEYLGTHGDIGCTYMDWPSNPGGAYLDHAWRVPSGLGFDILFLGLQWYNVDRCVDGWATSMIDANPDMPVVIFNHYGLQSAAAGIRCFTWPTTPPNDYGKVWDYVGKLRRQVFLILSGHAGYATEASCWLEDSGDDGHAIIRMMTNWQGRVYEGQTGAGWLRLLTFNTDDGVGGPGKVDVKTVYVGQADPYSAVWRTDAGSGEPYHDLTMEGTITFQVEQLQYRRRMNRNSGSN